MAMMFDPADDTAVDDQCCGNCLWWNNDLITDKKKCENYQSEFYGKKRPNGNGWCWAWTHEKGAGGDRFA